MREAEVADERNELPKRFADKWFSIREQGEFTALLNELEFPVDTMIVERTGWHHDAFLHPDGTTIGTPVPPTGVRRAKLRLRSGTAGGNWRGGTLDGWKEAVAPAFANGAVGREQFALGVMAGGSGMVWDFAGQPGVSILNYSGRTSRGKTTALLLASSASAAPTKEGSYQSLRKTDNGLESILASRSGITLCLDEAIPRCDLERVVRWAWQARVSESTQDPFTAALNTLRHALVSAKSSTPLCITVCVTAEPKKMVESTT